MFIATTVQLAAGEQQSWRVCLSPSATGLHTEMPTPQRARRKHSLADCINAPDAALGWWGRVAVASLLLMCVAIPAVVGPAISRNLIAGEATARVVLEYLESTGWTWRTSSCGSSSWTADPILEMHSSSGSSGIVVFGAVMLSPMVKLGDVRTARQVVASLFVSRVRVRTESIATEWSHVDLEEAAAASWTGGDCVDRMPSVVADGLGWVFRVPLPLPTVATMDGLVAEAMALSSPSPSSSSLHPMLELEGEISVSEDTASAARIKCPWRQSVALSVLESAVSRAPPGSGLAALSSSSGSIALLGDSQSGAAVFRRLLLRARADASGGTRTSVHALVHLGDTVQSARREPREWRSYLASPLAAANSQGSLAPLLWARGNHDVSGGSGALPERWSLHRVGAMAVLRLDSGAMGAADWQHSQHTGAAGNPGATNQAVWAAQAVRSDRWRAASLRVVLAHVPPCVDHWEAESWAAGDSGAPAGARRWLEQLFQRALRSGGHVHAVFSGHSHLYQRGVWHWGEGPRQRVMLATIGAAGGTLEDSWALVGQCPDLTVTAVTHAAAVLSWGRSNGKWEADLVVTGLDGTELDHVKLV